MKMKVIDFSEPFKIFETETTEYYIIAGESIRNVADAFQESARYFGSMTSKDWQFIFDEYATTDIGKLYKNHDFEHIVRVALALDNVHSPVLISNGYSLIDYYMLRKDKNIAEFVGNVSERFDKYLAENLGYIYEHEDDAYRKNGNFYSIENIKILHPTIFNYNKLNHYTQ